MRKVSLILAVLLFTVPAWANVVITCSFNGGTVTVDYNAVSETKRVRAFALDITVNKGTITDVDANVANYDPNYHIYPGSIAIVNGEVSDYGTAVASPDDHPDTQPGLGSSGITVEMGALYSPADDAHGPPKSGRLLRFTVSDPTCCVTITENDARGGVVMTDPNLDPTVVASGCCGTPPPCYPACKPDYSTWVAVGSPPCWCYPRQCHGDSDNAKEGGTKTGYYYVHFADLGLLQSAWNILEPTKGPGMNWPNTKICADFGHDKEGGTKTGYYRVHFSDLSILLASWNVLEPTKGPGVPPNCLNCP